jgi:hypothetical protein
MQHLTRPPQTQLFAISQKLAVSDLQAGNYFSFDHRFRQALRGCATPSSGVESRSPAAQGRFRRN